MGAKTVALEWAALNWMAVKAPISGPFPELYRLCGAGTDDKQCVHLVFVLFLAWGSYTPWCFLSDESSKGVLCYGNEVNFGMLVRTVVFLLLI